MSDELKKIYSKYFDDSGEMKPKGKTIMGEGLKGLSGPKTITEKGAFLPKAKDVATKAAKATKYGKIALGVVGAGLAAKQYLKSKMSDDKKEEPKNTNASVKAKRLKELEGELNIDSKRGGGMIIARGKDYIKDLL